MAHLKRYAMPKDWRLPRKEKTFVVRPLPGPHKKDRCIPLQVILRDILRYADSSREARQILSKGQVLVDKRVRKEPKFAAGLMDVIEIPEVNKSFRVVAGKKGLALERIQESETGRKLCRIQDKTTVKRGVTQLNLHDGRNILLPSTGKGKTQKQEFNAGDSVLISLPDQKILKHYRLAKGSPAFITGGRNMGASGIIKDVNVRKNMLEKSTVTIKTKEKDIETLRDYVTAGELS
jgi:small subunit ribosomal protein S4e